MMVKVLHNPFASIVCPICGKKAIADPDAAKSPMLPPTGGDYDYASTWLNSVKCSACKTEFKLKVKIEKVNWADSRDVEYFWDYPYVKRIQEVKLEHLVIP